jgi:hypothetical protein
MTKRLDLTPEERKTRDRQRANDRQKAYYERRREDEDFKKVRSDRYKTKGIQIDTPAETPTETPTPTPVIETPADAPVFTGNGLLLNLLKRNGVRLKNTTQKVRHSRGW